MAYRRRRTLRFAREMRSDPTKAEDLLWYHLRRRQMGVRFRRQEPIGPFIADFACLKARLIVEVDGDTHTDPHRDRQRDRWFQQHGWFVLRFWDGYVLDQTDDTIDLIDLALRDRSAVPDPLNLES
jgi:adenine-specific DNA-methyltransferase